MPSLIGRNLIIPDEEMLDFLMLFSSPFFRINSLAGGGGCVHCGELSLWKRGLGVWIRYYSEFHCLKYYSKLFKEVNNNIECKIGKGFPLVANEFFNFIKHSLSCANNSLILCFDKYHELFCVESPVDKHPLI